MILFKKANAKKKRVHIEDWQRESRKLKGDTGGYVEDGFGAVLLSPRVRQ